MRKSWNPTGAVGSRITVLHALSRPDGTTGYIDHMLGSATSEILVLPFSWKVALTGRYDVLHVHWPEFLVRGNGWLRTAAKRLLTLVLLLRLARGRIAVIRTVHNIEPHERLSPFEARVVRRIERATWANIRLNATTPVDPDLPHTVIPHGHYRDLEPFASPGPPVPGSLLYFGLIRRYKGIEDLLDAYRGLRDDTATLRIVGRPRDENLVRLIGEFERARPDVSASLGYLSDTALAGEIERAAVIVLPYLRMHNSGALLLALSMNRTVLAPRTPVNEAIQAEVGAEWLRLYPGAGVTAADLVDVLRRSRTKRVGDRPVFDGRDWDRVGRMHLEFYRAVLTNGRVHP